MNRYTIWESGAFRISHSYDFRLPGYLFVENLIGALNINGLAIDAQGQLGEVLGPQIVYIY